VTGRYVALEGIEGAGKSTVAERLVALLSADNGEVVAVREPGGTAPGERIRGVLLDHGPDLAHWTEALLFAAARAELASRVVAPALERGAWVVSDRSVYSSLAYQGGGRGLGIDEVRAVNEPGLRGTWPDLVVLLRIDPVGGLQRQEVPDRIGAEGIEFQARVAAAFDEVARREPDRFVVVDAAASLDEVVAAVHRHIREGAA
jgi:dTMP kinase